MATSASIYNQQRTNRQVLKRHRKDPPSLVMHLNNGHFRFERQSGIFTFDSPARAFLDCIRQQRVPVDLLDILVQSNVAFYEGCLIIEVHDHRPPSLGSSSSDPLPSSTLQRLSLGTASSSLLDRSRHPLYGNSSARRRAQAEARGSSISTGPEIYRVVLHATGETVWQDIKDLDAELGPGGVPVWTDEEALRVEAKVLALTSPPLCLTPDPHASKIANIMLAATAPSIAYNPPAHLTPPFYRDRDSRGVKRGLMNSVEAEEQAFKRRRRDLIMRLMEKGTAGQSEITRPLPGVISSAGIAASAIAAQRANGEDGNVPGLTATASSIFAPTFSRLGFIEHFREAKAANDKAGVPRPGGIGFGGANVGIAGGAGGAGSVVAPNNSTARSTSTAAANDSTTSVAVTAADASSKPAAKGKKTTKKKSSQPQQQQDTDASTTAGSPLAEEPASAAKPKKMSKKAKAAEEKAAKVAAENAAAEKAEKERKEAEQASKAKSKKKCSVKKKGAAKTATASSPADTSLGGADEVPATPVSEAASLAPADSATKGKKKSAVKKVPAKGSAGRNNAQHMLAESPSQIKAQVQGKQQQVQQSQLAPLPQQMQQVLQGLPLQMQMQPHQLQMQLQQAAQAQAQAAQMQAAAPDMSALGMNMLGIMPGMGARMNNVPVGAAGPAPMGSMPMQQQLPFLAAQQQMQAQQAVGMKPPLGQGGLQQLNAQHAGMPQGLVPIGMGSTNGITAGQMQNALQMTMQRPAGQQRPQQMQMDPNLAAQYGQLMAQLAWNQQQQQHHQQQRPQ